MITWVLLVLLAINLFAFVYVGLDKKRSVENSQRFSEVSFFLIAVFFSSLGVLLGMFAFRHKTRKFYFMLGMSLLLLEQAALVIYLLKAAKKLF